MDIIPSSKIPYCNLKVKKLINFSFQKNWEFGKVGDDEIGYYTYQIWYGEGRDDDRHNLHINYFNIHSKRLSYTRQIKGVTESILSDRQKTWNLVDSLLRYKL